MELRKYVISLMIFILMCSTLTSSDNQRWRQEGTSKSLEIQATMSPLVRVETEILSSTNLDSGNDGMPFYLTNDDVAATTASGGRKIAKWSLDSNTHNLNVSITANPLKSNKTNEPVDYVLTFSFQDGGEKKQEVQSTTGYNGKLFGEENKSISFNDAPIYFRLADNVDISSSDYPVDEYRATVEIIVTPGGDI